MTDSSIRSMALEYYRKRGASVDVLEDGPAESYRITPKEGASLRVTFAEEAPDLPGTDAPTPLTLTSPRWRAILDDLTSDVAVSYRYLVCQPMANPARTLTEALPLGFSVRKARLASVDNRVALGLSHRVNFDAPALSARRELMHHHLWDVETSQRLTSMEPLLYEAPTLMIRPQRFPSESTVRALLDRSLLLLDQDTDERGHLIEKELEQLYIDVENRTNQYYEQQMGLVLQREAQLSERCDSLARKLSEARTPDALARYQQELGNLQEQFSHLRAQRDASLAAIETACSKKLEQERERHELTALTELVSICHASYDVLTYQVELAGPAGFVIETELRYWPVSKELELPACKQCDGPVTGVPSVHGGIWLCASCVSHCPGCDEVATEPLAAHACEICQQGLCSACLMSCAACEVTVCSAHVVPSESHDTGICTACASAVPVSCAETVAEPEMPFPILDQGPVCGPDESEPEALPVRLGSDGDAPALQKAASSAVALLEPLMAFTAQAFGRVADVALAPVQHDSDEDLPLPEALRQPVTFAPRRMVDEASQDRALASLFDGPVALEKETSTRALEPACCPACQQQQEAGELQTCGTCGVSACRACAQGPLAPCPACETLAPTVASDPRLRFVLASFPDLKKGPRTWEVSVTDGYVVAHWSRWGTWGMVTYFQPENGAPARLIHAFRCGHVAALKQMITTRRKHA
ncbi:MAG: hypothetical protein VKN33_09840 [Candidatus Sericytochromatia bacterium]|nr:hypothetical protein [Candidatus Sericytochromatia bacterium]